MRQRPVWRLGWALWIAAGVLAQEPRHETTPQPADVAPARSALEGATRLLRAGRTAAARDLLLDLIATAPRHGAARTLLGRIDLERGDLEAAREHLEIAVAASPPRPYFAWHLLGRTRLAQGEPGSAREAWKRSLELAPRFPPAIRGDVRAALRLGDLDAAATGLEHALAIEPTEPEALLLLAEVHLLRGEAGSALSAFSRLRELPSAGPNHLLAAELLTLSAQTEPDRPRLRVALGHRPDLARGLLALGLAELGAGEPSLAEAALRAALATDDEDPVPWLLLRRLAGNGAAPPYPRPFPALSRRLEEARRLDDEGSPAAAERLAAILERRPHHLAARLLLARTLERRSDPDGDHLWEALDAYQDLLDEFPDVPALELAAARTTRAMGALGLAGCLARRASRALPQDATAAFLLAAVELDAGRWDGAAEASARAIDLGLEEAAVYVTLGLAEFERMDVASSMTAYSRALALDPETARGIPRFALSSLTTVEFGPLRELLSELLATEPDHREALYSLGVMSLRENDLEKALEYFERLAGLTPDDPQVQYNLAATLLRRGDRETGRAAMERFRRLEANEAELWLERNRAHVLRQAAEAAISAGAAEDALEIYRQMATAGTADPADYLAAGRACLALGDPRRALGWFEGILDQTPFHREALHGWAEAAETLGRSEEARRTRARVELLDWECEPGADTGS